MAGDKHTRRFPRRRYTNPVGMIHMAKYEMVHAVEIGEGGILLHCEKEMIVGQFVGMSFFIPQKGFVSVQGEILYDKKNDGKARHFGIKFTDLDFESKRMIRDYIALKTAEEAMSTSLLNF